MWSLCGFSIRTCDPAAAPSARQMRSNRGKARQNPALRWTLDLRKVTNWLEIYVPAGGVGETALRARRQRLLLLVLQRHAIELEPVVDQFVAKLARNLGL